MSEGTVEVRVFAAAVGGGAAAAVAPRNTDRRGTPTDEEHRPKKLHSVTRLHPGFTINTANGSVPVLAVGTALAYLRVGSEWQCYEIPNVLVLENCGATLYSTRVMHECHGFDHRVDQNVISVPGAADVRITEGPCVGRW